MNKTQTTGDLKNIDSVPLAKTESAMNVFKKKRHEKLKFHLIIVEDAIKILMKNVGTVVFVNGTCV